MMLRASKRLALSPLKWLSRRRCLQPLRVATVQLRRRLVVAVLWLLVRMVRRTIRRPCPGNPTR